MFFRVKFSYRCDKTLNSGKHCVHSECKNEDHTTHTSEEDMTSVLRAPLSAACFLEGPRLYNQISESDPKGKEGDEQEEDREVIENEREQVKT